MMREKSRIFTPFRGGVALVTESVSVSIQTVMQRDGSRVVVDAGRLAVLFLLGAISGPSAARMSCAQATISPWVRIPPVQIRL